MEFKFNDAKTVRPNHLERCLCYDKFLKGYRCYVYDDISKYWCTQATTEHDPNGDNHIVDYADYQVTKWASLPNIEQPSLPFNLDEAAQKVEDYYDVGEEHGYLYCHRGDIKDAFKAGAEWMAEQGYAFETTMQEDDLNELVPTCPDMHNHGYSCGDKVIIQIRKKEE